VQSTPETLTPQKDSKLGDMIERSWHQAHVGFLITGVMKVSLNVNGYWPADMERLNNPVKNCVI